MHVHGPDFTPDSGSESFSNVRVSVTAGLSFTRVLPSSARPSGAGPGGPDVQVLLPPAWQATTAAGQNMIDQANKVFFNTGIQ